MHLVAVRASGTAKAAAPPAGTCSPYSKITMQLYRRGRGGLLTVAVMAPRRTRSPNPPLTSAPVQPSNIQLRAQVANEGGHSRGAGTCRPCGPLHQSTHNSVGGRGRAPWRRAAVSARPEPRRFFRLGLCRWMLRFESACIKTYPSPRLWQLQLLILLRLLAMLIAG